MSDPSLPLQAELVGRLKAAAGLTALIGDRVYDEPPGSPIFPYVTLGESQVLPDKVDCIDGTELFPAIDAWSRAQGFPEVKQIGAAVIAALDDAALNVAGYNVIVFQIENIRYLRDPDGRTRHAALTFRALLQLA